MDDLNINDKTLIDKYEEDYKSALYALDNDVKFLIEQGKEMQGVLLFSEKVSEILEIHESLHTFYGLIYNYETILSKYKSERLRQLGHEPKATRELLKDEDATEEEIERFVLKELKSVGFNKFHWYLKSSLINEIEYMIDALHIMVEKDFVPFVDSEDSEDSEETDKPNRYISSSVKIAVWRRDQGKCVDCESKEKLEYDHIIPVSKGGSNTERNIQLLCEKCNRKKSAAIQ